MQRLCQTSKRQKRLVRWLLWESLTRKDIRRGIRRLQYLPTRGEGVLQQTPDIGRLVRAQPYTCLHPGRRTLYLDPLVDPLVGRRMAPREDCMFLGYRDRKSVV